ncbi:Transcription initiation factor TFIID subunit 9 [Ceratobasidium sp. 428]|nr:Transcription initiation factor TFIID subunit 9 [Ceratobasidium sp. 428]
MGGPVPKESLLALATKTNAQPLPTISDTYGTRIPPAKQALTSVDFDIVPNKPPPGMNDPETFEEEYEEWEEDDTPEVPPAPAADDLMVMDDPDEPIALVDETAPIQGGEAGEAAPQAEEEDNDADDLFGDAEADDDDNKMDQDTTTAEPAPASGSPSAGGVKRKIEEDDNYD